MPACWKRPNISWNSAGDSIRCRVDGQGVVQADALKSLLALTPGSSCAICPTGGIGEARPLAWSA